MSEVELEKVKKETKNEDIKYTKADLVKGSKKHGRNQINDHLNVIVETSDVSKDKINTFLFWPFLTKDTKDGKGKPITRWQKEDGFNVFTETLSNQKVFDEWFFKKVLKSGIKIEKNLFDKLFHRCVFIVLQVLFVFIFI